MTAIDRTAGSTASVPRQAGSIPRYGRSRPPWGRVAAGAVLFVVVSLVITYLRDRPSMTFDANGLPVRPTPEQAPYLTANHVVVTIVMVAIGLLGVALAVRALVRTKSWLPLMVALSAALIALPEVFYDVIGAVYFPHSDTEMWGHAYGFLGRTMPVWVAAGWFGYGLFCFGTYWMLSRRPTTRALWGAWLVAILGDIVFEELLLQFDVYHYYGNQPLVLIDELPWWWIPCNSVGVILAAALAHRFAPLLQGWRGLAMLVVTPMSVTAVYGFIAFPSWIAVNGDYPWLVTQVLGLVTVALGVLAFMGVLRLVLNRDPFDLDYAPTEAGEFADSASARAAR